MKFSKLLIVFLACLILTGCVNEQQVKNIVKTEVRNIESRFETLPDSLISRIEISGLARRISKQIIEHSNSSINSDELANKILKKLKPEIESIIKKKIKEELNNLAIIPQPSNTNIAPARKSTHSLKPSKKQDSENEKKPESKPKSKPSENKNWLVNDKNLKISLKQLQTYLKIKGIKKRDIQTLIKALKNYMKLLYIKQLAEISPWYKEREFQKTLQNLKKQFILNAFAKKITDKIIIPESKKLQLYKSRYRNLPFKEVEKKIEAELKASMEQEIFKKYKEQALKSDKIKVDYTLIPVIRKFLTKGGKLPATITSKNVIYSDVSTLKVIDIIEGFQELDYKLKEQFKGKKGIRNFIDKLRTQEALYKRAIDEGLLKDNSLAMELKLMLLEKIKENYITHITQSKVKVDEKELKAEYEKVKSNFKIKEQVRAAHILVDTEKQAKDILTKIKSGEKFEDLAAKYSKCPSKSRGGDLGYFGRGRMVKPFEKAAFALKPGEISQIVKTRFGYHIIKCIDKKEAKTLKFKDVANNIRKRLEKQKQIKLKYDTLNKIDNYINSISINKTLLSKLTAPEKIKKRKISKNKKEKLKKPEVSSKKSKPETTAEDVLAIVGNRKITFKDLNAKINTVPPFLRAQFRTTKGKKRVLDRLIDVEILVNEVKKKGLDPLKLENISNINLARTYLSEVFEKTVRPDLKEMKAYYERNKNRFKKEKRVQISRILLNDRETAELVYKKLKQGENFESLARKYSVAPDAAMGGKMGYIRMGSVDPRIYETAMNLKEGKFSEIIELPAGFTILKADKVENETYIPFDKVKNRIRNNLRRTKAKRELNAFIEKLKKKLNVKVYYELLNLAESDIAKNKDRVLFSFKNKEFTLGDFMKQLELFPEAQKARMQSYNAKRKLLDNIINVMILAEFAKKEGFDKSSKYRTRMNEAIMSNFVRTYIKELKDKFKKDVKITEEELKKRFEKQKLRFKQRAKCKVSHILVKSKELADEIMKKLKAGENFEELAKKYSLDRKSAEKGGNVGYIVEGRGLDKEMSDAIFNTKVGEIAGPIKSRRGYHIIKVTDKIPEHEAVFEKVKERLKKELIDEKVNKKYLNWLSKLKKEVYKVKSFYSKLEK